MGEEWQPDAVLKAKTGQLKLEFFDYIEKSIDKIDANIPVFFGHVAATIDNSLPGISDDVHDQFIDAVTMKVLECSKKSSDVPSVEKLFDYAMRNKRGKKGKAIYDIILGLRMVTDGRYTEAIEHLKRYRNVDAIICPAIAYCYYTLSNQQVKSDENPPSARPSDLALAAREQMMDLVNLKPPVNRLRYYEVAEDPRITKIFWFMLKFAIEWFPSEGEFLRTGVEKATKDGNADIKEELLTIAIERFCNDMYFLREMYRLKLEQRDAGGLAGIVKQMTQLFPDDIEPVYYGLKLAVMAARSETYSRFRKLALAKNFPSNILLLSDFAFELMSGKQYEALACLDEIRQKLGPRHYYVTMLDYVVSEFFSDDQKKVKKAKKALIDSLDQYCMLLLKIRTT
jgi:hypothetical protein